MVTKKSTLQKIRQIVDKNYSRLAISVLGNGVLSDEQIDQLKQAGVDTTNKDSLMSLVYYHNFINHPVDGVSPRSVEDMKRQQGVSGLKPEGQANDYTVENINDKTNQFIEKLKLDVLTRIETIIRENNDNYKMDALKNMSRQDIMDELVKESTLGKLKQRLKDTAGDGNRDWLRVAITEMSNAIGLGSMDRIVTEHRDGDLDEVYVYRITVKDAKTCKWCRRFYDDDDGSPKLYRLSTLMSNGSNYGKKTDSWRPVVGATHPFERCSQVLELKPGFKLTGEGPTYIGLEKWNDYILQKLQK